MKRAKRLSCASFVLLCVVSFGGCSSSPRYQQTSRLSLMFDTKTAKDCWAKESSPEREHDRELYQKNPNDAIFDPPSDPNVLSGFGPGGVAPPTPRSAYDPNDYPYCSDLK